MRRPSRVSLTISAWLIAAPFVGAQAIPVHVPSYTSGSPNPDEPTTPPPRGAIVVSGTTQKAKLRTAPAAVYPPLARSAKVQGVCRFHVLIGENGSVSNIAFVRGHPLLVNAAREALWQYRYDKTVIDGVDKKVWTVVEVDFVLRK